jgi:hypothetical protein
MGCNLIRSGLQDASRKYPDYALDASGKQSDNDAEKQIAHTQINVRNETS